MSCRLFAVIVCVAAARRWPALWFVAGALGCEDAADDVATFAHGHGREIVAALAWALPSIAIACIGSSLGTKRRWPTLVMSCAHLVATVYVYTSAWWQVAVSTVACATSAAVLIRRTELQDISRAVPLVMLVGYVASGTMTLLIGVDEAYKLGIVSTSNDCVHLVIAGLTLWAMRAH